MSWENKHYIVGLGEEKANLIQDPTKNRVSLSSIFQRLYGKAVSRNRSFSEKKQVRG